MLPQTPQESAALAYPKPRYAHPVNAEHINTPCLSASLMHRANYACQDTPWPGASRTPGVLSAQSLVPSAAPSAKRLRTQLTAGALAIVPAPLSNAAPGDGAVPDIMTFFAQRADRAQGLEATITVFRDANAQLGAQLAERAAEARANRVRPLPHSLRPCWPAAPNRLRNPGLKPGALRVRVPGFTMQHS